VTKTIAASGLLQIQAVFTDGIGDSYTTSPVTETLDITGTGGDFATASVGPVIVGLQSGNLSFSATDVSISSSGAGLSVSRAFNSLAPGTSSIFGPGWTSSLPSPGTTMNWSSVTDNGSYAVLTSYDGSVLTFLAGIPSNGITPYTAVGSASAQGLVLSKSSSGFTLTDPSGDQAQFVAANANSPSFYTPSQVTQPGTTHSVGYIYDATKTDANYGKPLLMVAPNANLAAGTSSTSACPYPPSSSTWANGCRGLKFSYDATTGNVSEIDFVYMQSGILNNVPVANYTYDSSGRLTSEWDPRMSPNLVTSYTYDENSSSANYGRLLSYSPPQSASGSLAPWTFTYNTTSGSADYGKLISVTRTHSNGTATQTISYEVPLTTAAGGPISMDAATVGTWNQTDVPASAVAIFPATHVPSSPPTASDWQYAQITYYDANGLPVNTANYGSGAWNITTTQYDSYGDVISQLSASDRAEALAAGSSSASVAAELQTVTDYTASADGSQLTKHVYGPLHNANVPGQGTQQIRDEILYQYDQNAPSGGPYDVVTTASESASLGAGIPGTSNADNRTTTYVYNNGTDNIGWTLRRPLQKIVAANTLKITNTTVYNENSSLYGGEPLVVETCRPSDTSCSGAGTTKYIYYTGGTNPVDSACGGHAMWANLVCKTQPAAQPGTAGLPSLPVTTYTYNIYQQVLTKTETFGSSTRTTTYSYTPLRQPDKTTVTTSGSGMGNAVQTMENTYFPATGLLSVQQVENSSGAVTAQVAYGYDDFGQLNAYTDGAGNPTSYTYYLDGKLKSRNDGKGTITIIYDTRGLPTSETDSQAGQFTVAYNPDGNLSSETYPGGLTASYGYDETGAATTLSYAGESWTSPLNDSIVRNAHGDWASQNISDTSQSLASNQAYTYDTADRLTRVQDTENGQCTTNIYTYDADSNRTSLTTDAPASGGACQTTTGTTTNYSYDGGDRLTNSGYTYDTQGDITAIPSVDAGSTGNLTATYYANDMLASQTQNGQTISWQLDPTENRFASYTANGITYTNHYSDPSSNVTWSTGSDGSWSRAVPGLNGMLSAMVNSSGVTLELVDLHGDIIAIASTNPASTGPQTAYIYYEFGVTETGSPGSYGWLGGYQISSKALGATLLMGVRAYNPYTGRFDQTDPVTCSCTNAYGYAYQNPVTNVDLNGMGRGTWYSWGRFPTLWTCISVGLFVSRLSIVKYWYCRPRWMWIPPWLWWELMLYIVWN